MAICGIPKWEFFGHYKEFRDATNSLYRMPIAILSLETAELERSCMIKNLSLSTANEPCWGIGKSGRGNTFGPIRPYSIRSK